MVGPLGAPCRGHHGGHCGARGCRRRRSRTSNNEIYATIDAWRNRPFAGEHPYVYLDGIVMKRSWAGEVRNVSLLVAIGLNGEGYREILGIVGGAKEDKAGWSGFLKHLQGAGLERRAADHLGCVNRLGRECGGLPGCRLAVCVVHFYRNVFRHVPRPKMREVAAMLKAIHAAEDVAAAREKAR